MTNIPQKPHQRKPDLTPEQWAQYDRLKDDPQHYSSRAIVKMMDLPYARAWRAVQARLPVPLNGTAPSVPASTPTALERTIVKGEPVSTLPEYPSTPAYYHLQHQVDALQQQVEVLTAFMATIQQHPTYDPRSTPSIPEYSTPRAWKKSGVEYAADMPDQLGAYAKAHGMQVREVVDLALRRLFAAEGRHDA
jgi:hypothetical protein